MTSGCNLFSVGVVTILLAFHIWNKTILLLREIENLEAEQDIFCPSSGLRLRHPLLAHTWLSERSANAKPCVLSALALPRPGSARRPPLPRAERRLSRAGPSRGASPVPSPRPPLPSCPRPRRRPTLLSPPCSALPCPEHRPRPALLAGTAQPSPAPALVAQFQGKPWSSSRTVT